MQGSPTVSKALFSIVFLLTILTVWGVVVYSNSPEDTTPIALQPTVTPSDNGEEQVNVDLNATPTVSPTPTTEVTEIPNATATPATRRITITANEYSFAPNAITASAGDTLIFTIVNNGTEIHSFAIDELGVQTTTINPEETVQVQVEIPTQPNAQYEFYSSIGTNRSQGMVGQITIQIL